MKKIQMVMLLILAAVVRVSAAPAVTGVQGTVVQGGEIVLNGSGFGSHPDDHAAADKMIRMFDDFNDANLLDNDYARWSAFNGTATPSPVVHATGGARTSSSSDRFYRRTNVGLGFLSIAGTNKPEYFASFYMRLSDGFDITSASSGSHQFKIVRLYSTNNNVNLYPAIGHTDGFNVSAEFVKPDVLRHQSQMNSIPNKPSGWHRMTVYIKKSSAKDANDGRLRIWWDNKLAYDWAQNFQGVSGFSGDFDNDDGNLAGDWAIGNYFSSAGSQTWVDFDDVYLSHTQARVEIGNAPTYAACTVLEMQPPKEWASGQIKVKVNLGALGSSRYVYVTDAAGAVNANGYPLDGSTPPPAPEPEPQPVPDTTAPALRILAPSADAAFDASAESVIVSGTASDDKGVSSVSWTSSRGGSGQASGTGTWSFQSSLAEGDNVITVTARDAAGNTAVRSIAVTRGRAAPRLTLLSPENGHSTTARDVLLTGASERAVSVEWAAPSGTGTATGIGNWTCRVPLIVGDNVITLSARDAEGRAAIVQVWVTRTLPADLTPPSLTIHRRDALPSVTREKIFRLTGSSSDDRRVKEIRWKTARGESGVVTGVNDWSAEVPLSEGLNEITITAVDEDGNVNETTVSVVRAPEETPVTDVRPASPAPERKVLAEGVPLKFGSEGASLVVYDLNGRPVHESSANGGALSWDGRSNGAPLPGGAYVCRVLSAQGETSFYTVVLVR